MITKSDWQAASRQLMADHRRSAGDPPTAEEMLAYTRGELSPEQEARVRERLVNHPDLVRTLTEPFPSEGAEPGDSDFVSDEEFATHWESLQKRTRPREPSTGRGRVLQFYQAFAAVAATVALLLGGLLWRMNTLVHQPRVISQEQVLFPDGRRGPAETVPLKPEGESVLLITPLIGQRDFERYRLEIVNAASGRAVWSSAALRPRQDDAFAILVPRRFLKPGTWQIVVYGSTGRSEERLATYSLRVP